MKVLALDLATNCGVAIGDIAENLKPKYSTEVFHNKDFDGAGMRYVNFYAFMESTIRNNHIELVVYEGVRKHTGVTAAHLYGGWLSTLQIACENYDVPYTAFGVGEIKKFWTGNGSATKDHMIGAARKKGLDPKDDNQADALAIWYMAKDRYGKITNPMSLE